LNLGGVFRFMLNLGGVFRFMLNLGGVFRFMLKLGGVFDRVRSLEMQLFTKCESHEHFISSNADRILLSTVTFLANQEVSSLLQFTGLD